jgi:toxin FitB
MHISARTGSVTERHLRGVLDTCVVVDLGEIDPGTLPVSPKLTTVTLAELGLGVAMARDSAQRALRLEQLQEAESSFAAVPFDSGAARRFHLLAGLVVDAGRNPKPRKADLMVAAVASVHLLPLYTRNGDDFKGLESVLRIVSV